MLVAWLRAGTGSTGLFYFIISSPPHPDSLPPFILLFPLPGWERKKVRVKKKNPPHPDPRRGEGNKL